MIDPAKTDWQSIIEKLNPEQITYVLQNFRFEVIDNRSSGGSLWVIDEPRLKELVSVLNSSGYHFIFASNGSISTKNRPAWYMKSVKYS